MFQFPMFPLRGGHRASVHRAHLLGFTATLRPGAGGRGKIGKHSVSGHLFLSLFIFPMTEENRALCKVKDCSPKWRKRKKTHQPQTIKLEKSRVGK